MEIRSTLILSLFLHITFSAVLLLLVRSQGDSGKMLNDKVFFVDLKSDVEEPTAAVTKEVSLRKTVVKKIRKEPAVIVEKRDHTEKIIVKDSMSDKRETESLSINSADTSGTAEVSDKTSTIERVELTSRVQAGEDNITNSQSNGDKRDGLTEADVLRLISAAIERAKTYPALARRRNIEGTVYVSFRVGSGGEPGDIKLLKSSGYKILDETTLKIVKKAAPYPYIDDRVEVPVTYRLNN
jgi:protein TonB